MLSLTKKSHFLLVGSGAVTTYNPSNTKFSIEYFNISYNYWKNF